MDYEKLGAEIGKLVTEKQKAYGDSFSKSGAVMRILYPDGVGHEQLDDALVVVRVLDKLFRVATNRDAFSESPWRDIVGYALLSVARVELAKTTPHVKDNLCYDLGCEDDTALKKQKEAYDLMEAERLKLLGRLGISGTKYPCMAIGEDFRGNLEPDKPCILERGHGSWHEDRMGDQWWSDPPAGDK